MNREIQLHQRNGNTITRVSIYSDADRRASNISNTAALINLVQGAK